MRRVAVRLCHLTRSVPLHGRSFVKESLFEEPNDCFSDILFRWRHGHQQCAMSEYDTSEAQMLNTKCDELLSTHLQRLLPRYSTAHFAAEAGSVSLLELLSSSGVVCHAFPHKKEDSILVENELATRVRVALGDVALCFPDAEGRFLSHLAAQWGHKEVVSFLTHNFGAESILSQQQGLRAFAPLTKEQMVATNPTPYTKQSLQAVSSARRLNVYETAFVYGHVPLLEWIDTAYPHHGLRTMTPILTERVRLSAAFGHASSLDYLRLHQGDAAREVLVEAMCPAAEAGNAFLLHLLVDWIGADAVWHTDAVGATPLHHAARFGRTELLDSFFAKFDVRTHVDDRDNRGLTPAMWCVLGGKGGRNVAFMRRLLELGSEWPNERDYKGRSIDAIALQRSSTRGVMWKFITSCVAQVREDISEQKVNHSVNEMEVSKQVSEKESAVGECASE